jgi:membrane protease YdiL (CAAX protease family)
LWRYLDRKRLVDLGLRTAGAGPMWLRGAIVAALMMGFIVLGWYTLVDGADWLPNPDLGRATVAVIVGLLAFAVQGPSEEILFRGYILENVRARWGVRIAIAVSALSFALIHARNTSFGVLPFINLVLFGVAAALYKVRVDGGQLWGVFAIHSIWNWLQQVVFGLPNSGFASSPENTLFSVRPNANVPDVIWGGGFGPEGTLAASLVLAALTAFLLRKTNRSS